MQKGKSLPAQRQKPPKDDQEDEAEVKHHYQIGKETVHKISGLEVGLIKPQIDLRRNGVLKEWW